MKLEILYCGITLSRDPDDPPLRRESAVVTAILKLLYKLNKPPSHSWRRFRPDLHGLTGSKLGIIGKPLEPAETILYWHERYAIELAHQAYNAGEVFFQRAGAKGVYEHNRAMGVAKADHRARHRQSQDTPILY